VTTQLSSGWGQTPQWLYVTVPKRKISRAQKPLTSSDSSSAAQAILLWHKDYFEMKIIEKKQVQEELSTLPSLPSSMA